jgi:uncharacterized protein YgfB (UPF0149 family)
MIHVLRYLNQDAATPEHLSDQLVEELGNMSEAIKDFGSFSKHTSVFFLLIPTSQVLSQMSTTRNANHGWVRRFLSHL